MFTGFGVDDMSCDVRVALLFLRRDGFLPGGTYRRDQEYEEILPIYLLSWKILFDDY